MKSNKESFELEEYKHMSCLKKTKRNSSIEVLKVFAVILIVFSHAMPSNIAEYAGYMDLSMATESIQRLIIVFMKYGGQFGDAIFIVCSAWFLVDSVKFNPKKVSLMVLDSFVISIGCMTVFVALGLKLSTKEIIRQFFPLFFGNNWFLCCYICYYLIHPLLNWLIEKMSQKLLLYFVISMSLIYSFVNTVRGGAFYGTDLMSFITIHFIVGYMKMYLPKICKNIKLNLFALLLSGMGMITLVLFTNYLGLHIGFLSNQLSRWNTYRNPLIILFALSLLNLCNSRVWYNRGVNYLSSLSLLIYLIHANKMIVDHVRSMVFAWIFENYTYQYELAWVCLFGVVLLAYSTFFAVVYKHTIQRLTNKITGHLCEGAKKRLEYLTGYLMRFS